MKGHFAALALIVFGIIALGVNLGWFELDVVAMLRTWWPAALIALGVALFFTPDDDTRRR